MPAMYRGGRDELSLTPFEKSTERLVTLSLSNKKQHTQYTIAIK